jgi:hypothetical protein
MTALWDLAPCSHVEVDRRCKGPNAFIIRRQMKAVRTSETSVYFYETRQPPGKLGSNLQNELLSKKCISKMCVYIY